jgi:hypothetical protein
MSQKEVVLDLANSRSWKLRVAAIIDELLPVEVRCEICSRDPEWIFSDTFEYVMDAFAASGEEVALDELNYRLDQLFSRHFTHWRAYHACRPRSLASYKANGIVPLSREFVISEAVALFRGHAPVERIRDIAAKVDLQTREGDICLFADRISPLARGQNHYLRSGSEIMQVIASSFAPCQGILAGQGSPFIIQCKIPLCDLKPELKLEGYRELVTRFFQHEMSNGRIHLKVLDHCLRTSRCIQPKNIERFIPVEKASLEGGIQSDH